MATESPFSITLESRDSSDVLITSKSLRINGILARYEFEGEDLKYINGKIKSGARRQRRVYDVVFSNFHLEPSPGITQISEDYEELQVMLRAPRLYLMSTDFSRGTRVYSVYLPARVEVTRHSYSSDFTNANDKLSATFSEYNLVT